MDCIGDCCDGFSLSDSIEDACASDPEHAEQIRWMLIRRPLYTDGSPRYTCRFWNKGTKRCMAYELRPNFCREYPSEDPCKLCGMTPEV